MNATFLLPPAVLLACLPISAQQARDPNPPTPPTASSITSSAPQLPTNRPEAPPVASVPVPQGAGTDLRRSARRPDAKVLPQVTNVQFDRPTATGPLWVMGHDWKASFDGTGFAFVPFLGSDAPRNFPVRFELDQATVGGQALPLVAGEPQQQGFSVRTQRGGLVEVVDASLRSVEQSFVFATLPNRGAVKVEIKVDSDLVCTPTANGLSFGNDLGSVRYEKAVAIDASGAQLALPITWTGSEIHIEIPATFVEHAQLPLVLDPILSSNQNVASGFIALQRDPDVAVLQGLDRTCIAWLRQFSATDWDAFAQIFDGASVATTAMVTLDFTSLDWRKLAVASNNFAQNFLVVSEIGSGTTSYIGGRGISATGTVGGLFDIERNGIVGLPGNNFRPDVGGDFYPGVGYYAVVFEKEVAVGNNDIYVKLVTTSGTLLTTNPSVVDNATTNERFPSISKCNGSFGSPAGPSQWFVSYQRTWPFSPFDEEVLGKFVLWNGAVQTPSMYIAGTIANESRATSSSPADINGVRYWMCCYEVGPSGGRDVICKLYDTTGALVASLNLDAAEVGGALASYDRNTADVDSDGTRFVVTYMDPWNGTADWETHATTLAYVSGTSLRIDDERIGLGLSAANEVGPKIMSVFSGGGLTNSRYVIAEANFGLNNINLYNYGGWNSGAQFSYYSSACGAPLAITPTGNTAIGGNVTITVANGGLSGTVFGYPGFIPLNALGCNCILGVNNGLLYGNPFVWNVPNNPVYVGFTLSVQGWTALGTNCLGFVDLSDTVDFTIR